MKDALKGVLYVALFAIPFIPLIVTDSMFFPFITGKNFTFRILVEIAFASCALLALYDAQFRPKFSWVLTGFTAIIVVMFAADMTGEFPLKSLWSNFERMDGFVTLAHVFLYLVALGSTLRTQKGWNWFFNTTLFAASILSLYAFGQLSGAYQINQGGVRVDGTLGNAAYMAVYMLFHVFFAVLMAVRTRGTWGKAGYGALAAIFFYLLVQTATRGTLIGIVGGAIVTTLYIALFSGKQAKELRQAAIIGLVAVAVLVGGFIAARDTSFVQENQILSRIASISLKEGSTRFEIWSMAFEGVKERPVLGWGQGNFNYVFNKYYQPELWGQEPWFDRVHNIVMDWLIAGGVLGLLAYASVFIGSLYHVVVRSLFFREEEFSVPEQGLLLGILAAYFVHNFFVFDNIVSYIFFGTVLAFIHSRVATKIDTVENFRMPEKVINNVAVPTGLAVTAAVVYFVNVPAIQASADIIDAFTTQTPQGMLAEFESALARGSFADQEIREQLTQRAQQIARAEGVSEDMKQAFAARTEAELLKQIDEKPGDARVHVFVSSYYRSVGNLEAAREQLVQARKFSPLKQQIIFEQGFVEMQSNDFQKAVEFMKEAYELDESYPLARGYYIAALMYAGNQELANELATDEQLHRIANNDIMTNAALNTQNYELLTRIAKKRVELDPSSLQNRVGLAAVYYDSGNTQESIAELERIIADFPDFKEQGETFIEDIKAGRKPGSTPVSVTAGGVEVEAVAE